MDSDARRSHSLPMIPDDTTRIAAVAAAARIAALPLPYDVLFERGDVTVEFYAPRGVDRQEPHDRDEIYVVATGSGTFVRGEERVPFGPGDFLYVSAFETHRFEDFGEDFGTWVVFFGPVGGCRPGA
jgi:mannose-6-phosphate isomerase-like protein (cupin superfamily)